MPQNREVGIIKSQKAIVNTHNLTWKPRKRKITEREKGEFHYNNGDYKWVSLVCSGFWIQMMMIIPLHIGRDRLFIQVISKR